MVAFALNFVPYLGTLAPTAVSGLMAFVQFGSLDMVLLVAGIGMLWGLLLGVPILTTINAICDRVEELKPIGELMGA